MHEALFLFLNGFSGKSSSVDAIVLFGAVYLIFLLLLSLCVYLFLELKKGNLAFTLIFFRTFFIGAIAWGIARVVKVFFENPRPFLIFEDITPLFIHGSTDAFPSGHTTFVAALGMALYFYNKKVGALLLLVALLIGFSRVVAGVHWPLDVLGGFSLGIFVAMLFQYLFAARRLLERRLRN
jgi:undecaprenyl-diphosphatase